MNRSALIGKSWLVLTLAAASIAAAACGQQPTTIILGDSDDSTDGGTGGSGSTSSTMSTTSGGTQTAHDKFVNDVYPSIQPTCGSCHAASGSGAPVWLATNAEGSYTAITNFTPTMIAVPDNSTLVLHGAHTGPGLSPDQEQKVSDWLMMEVEERGLAGGGDTPPPTKTLAEALDEFAACMSIDDWTAAGMNNLPSSQTGNAGACNGCHNAGDGGTYLSLNVDETFAKNKEFPYIKRLVTGTVDENGNFADLVAARRFIEKGQEPCGENQNCHPKYSLPPNMVTAVESFVDITLENWRNGTCPTMP